uniref:MULE transposase domain-containing protein n=1 Tax=Tanacetum cinerariifolium TaxID=118510 RepID=A0A699HXM1_TANCI|nr:hypothetical protein [Tanacetum cinerariifolium]
MRPLLITDGAHLKGTYKGINLVLVGMNENNQIIPIATCVPQGETRESWTWFLLKFKQCMGEVPNLAIIMDRHPTIILACNLIFPNAFHGAESINNLSRHVRKAPITMLMEWYRALLQKWYCARREKYQDSSVHTLSDWATHKVMDIMQKSANWKVYGIHRGIPCGHVIAVGRVMGCIDCSDTALDYSPAYNNNNGRSQEYEAAYNNINFSGMAQYPHPTMPFAFNQFNFGQTLQPTDSSMPFT